MQLKELFEDEDDADEIDPSMYVLIEITPWLSLGNICVKLQDEHSIWARTASHKTNADIQNQKLVVKKDDAKKVVKMINTDKMFDTKNDKPTASLVKPTWYHFFHTYL